MRSRRRGRTVRPTVRPTDRLQPERIDSDRVSLSLFLRRLSIKSSIMRRVDWLFRPVWNVRPVLSVCASVSVLLSVSLYVCVSVSVFVVAFCIVPVSVSHSCSFIVYLYLLLVVSHSILLSILAISLAICVRPWYSYCLSLCLSLFTCLSLASCWTSSLG